MTQPSSINSQGLISKDSFLYSIKEYIGGWIGGIAKVMIGQPFDTIKVRVQSVPGTNPITEIKKLIKNEGPLAFYKGTLSPLIGISGIVSLQFGSCEMAKRNFKEYLNVQTLPLIYVYLSGCISGICGSLLVIPVEHIRIRIQIQKNKSEALYTGSIDAFNKIVKQYGVKGLYKGFWITQLREFFGYGSYYWIYEYLMRYGRVKYRDSSVYRYLPLIMGSFAGPFFWASIYMFDTIKSKIQSDSLTNPTYKRTLDCVKATWRQGGFLGFWKGFDVCFIRSIPVNAGVFFVYEETMSLFVGKKH